MLTRLFENKVADWQRWFGNVCYGDIYVIVLEADWLPIYIVLEDEPILIAFFLKPHVSFSVANWV